MGQAIGETVFDAVYLVLVVTLGVIMIKNSKGSRETLLFGVMAVVLGGGDAFHLVPRLVALWTTGLEANAVALGVGKLVTSITMTLFYVLLYLVWQARYKAGKKGLSAAVYLLAAARVALCLFPQNEWTNYNAPLSWGIYRNIPFLILGIITIVIWYTQAKKQGDRPFRFMWLAVLLSFALYIPVVLFADVVPAVGMLMIPKTLAYVWIVWMGFSAWRRGRKKEG